MANESSTPIMRGTATSVPASASPPSRDAEAARGLALVTARSADGASHDRHAARRTSNVSRTFAVVRIRTTDCDTTVSGSTQRHANSFATVHRVASTTATGSVDPCSR